MMRQDHFTYSTSFFGWYVVSAAKTTNVLCIHHHRHGTPKQNVIRLYLLLSVIIIMAHIDHTTSYTVDPSCRPGWFSTRKSAAALSTGRVATIRKDLRDASVGYSPLFIPPLLTCRSDSAASYVRSRNRTKIYSIKHLNVELFLNENTRPYHCCCSGTYTTYPWDHSTQSMTQYHHTTYTYQNTNNKNKKPTNHIRSVRYAIVDKNI